MYKFKVFTCKECTLTHTITTHNPLITCTCGTIYHYHKIEVEEHEDWVKTIMLKDKRK